MTRRSGVPSNPELISSTKMGRAKESDFGSLAENPEVILQNEANAIDVEFVDENGGGLGVRLRHRRHKNLLMVCTHRRTISTAPDQQ
jgi:hypothetical protein